MLKIKLGICLFLILLSGCATPEIFQLERGRIVTCEEFQESFCGVYLNACDDSRVYYCQKNVSKLTPTEYMNQLNAEMEHVNRMKL